MKRWLCLLLISLLPLFAACSSSDDKSKEPVKSESEIQEEKTREAQDALKKKTLPICPQVAIVRELDDIHDYGAEKPDPSQLVMEARMETVDGNCAYSDDGTDIMFDLNLIAGRGPRLGGDRGSLPYFIAVVDPDQNILTKDKMTVEFKFQDEKKVDERTEHLHVFIPMPKDKQDAGPNYQVLLGFQLTQEQLDAIRSQAAQVPEVQPGN